MDKATCSLSGDIRNPCYSLRKIYIREIKEKSLLLFHGKAWHVLFRVESLIGKHRAVFPFLKVNILEYFEFNVSGKTQGLFLCGADSNVKMQNRKIVLVPFIEVGLSFYLTDQPEKMGKLRGFFYDIIEMYMLAPTHFA